MSIYTQDQIDKLVEGKLDWDTTLRMLTMPKDAERFQMYLDTLQRRLDWEDRIVLPLGPHLHIVQKAGSRQWVTKCECGHELGDWKDNWKLHAHIYVREDDAAMSEVYPTLMAPDTQWQVYREYYCPQCATMLDVEAPTPWYPVIHDFEPDIDAFYRDWMGLPVPEHAGG